MNDLALLILDERASAIAMAGIYHKLNNYLLEVYEKNGITVLANDQALEGNGKFLEVSTGISFFSDWKINKEYRKCIEQALLTEDVYVMIK